MDTTYKVDLCDQSRVVWADFLKVFRFKYTVVNIILNPFSTNVPLMDKPGSWFFLAKCLENTCGTVTCYIKMQVDDLHFYVKCYSSKGIFQTFFW